MSWVDPDSAWARAQRRRVRGAMAQLVLLPCVLLAAPTIVLFFVPRPTGVDYWRLLSGGLLFLVAANTLVLALCVPILWRRLRVERAIGKCVPQCDGRVCPWCRVPLREETQGDRCAQCGTSQKTEKIRAYWEAYALDPIAAGKMRATQLETKQRSGAKTRLTRLQEYLVANKDRPRLWIAIAGIYFVLVGLIVWLIGRRDLLEASAESLRLVLTFVGAFLFFYGLRRRVGDEPRCAACDYQQPPEGEIPDRCPECGAFWKRGGGTVRGRKVRTPWMMWVGLPLFCLSFLTPFMGGIPVELIRSNGSLIDQVTQGSHALIAADEWKELQTRKLTPDQRLKLAEGLLRYRQSRGHLSPPAQAWFLGEINAGALPTELVNRYYREMIDIVLSVPEGPVIGEFDVFITATNEPRVYGGLNPGDEYAVYFGGFFVGDSDTAINRSKRRHNASLFGNESEYTPTARITPESTGPLRVRAVLWTVVAPTVSLPWKINWNPDGTPVLPTQMTWWERIELEQTVEVGE